MGSYDELGTSKQGLAGFFAEIKRRIDALERNQSAIPTGTVVATARTDAPKGYLLCGGAVVKRADQEALFGAIGTTYNTGGEAADEFRLPNFNSGRFPRGSTGGGGAGGAATHTLTTGETPPHTHPAVVVSGSATPLSVRRNDAGISGGSGYELLTEGPTGDGQLVVESGGGSGGAHNNLPPYQDVRYIIKT